MMFEDAMEENKRLLSPELPENEERDLPTMSERRERLFLSPTLYQKLRRIYFICLHVIPFLLFIGFVLDSFQSQNGSDDGIYTPVASPITYVVKTERQNGTLMHSAYTGRPSDENTHAWEDLIAPLIFNATAEELVLTGEPIHDSVKVATGGYMASLGVYHELHCLRRIRLWLYREVYYPNATRDDELFMQVHLGHCIEVLRLSAMCTADLGLYSFPWASPDASKPQARSSSRRKCMDWSTIDQWSRERMIPNTHLPLLKDDGL